MKLSLSVRIAESFSNKEKVDISFDEIVELAASLGYDAVCMRASVAGIETPTEVLEQMRRKLDAANLAVSMVTGDFAVPRNDQHGPEGLRNITPYLDLAQLLDAELIRICMKVEDDIPWARKAADEAAERDIRLAHQAHCASLFETVDGSLDVLRAVGRPNFGIIYEPANWMLSGQAYGGDAIRRVRPWLFNTYLQNHRLNRDGEASVESWQHERVCFDHIGLWDPGGVDGEEVFAALHEVGYEGYVTVHQAFAGIMSPADAARRSYEYLKPLTAR